MKIKIYTRTGDKGQTSLFGGKRVSKDSLRVEAIGSVDELNSAIGLAIAQVSSIKKELIAIQQDLFEIGATLANPKSQTPNLKRYLEKRVNEFEQFIDEMTEQLPVLRNFILAGGERITFLQFARTVCRRAERRVVSLSKEAKIDPSILIYLNRLSDLLFIMARFVNYKVGGKEIVWIKKK